MIELLNTILLCVLIYLVVKKSAPNQQLQQNVKDRANEMHRRAAYWMERGKHAQTEDDESTAYFCAGKYHEAATQLDYVLRGELKIEDDEEETEDDLNPRNAG